MSQQPHAVTSGSSQELICHDVQTISTHNEVNSCTFQLKESPTRDWSEFLSKSFHPLELSPWLVQTDNGSLSETAAGIGGSFCLARAQRQSQKHTLSWSVYTLVLVLRFETRFESRLIKQSEMSINFQIK